MCQNIVSPLGVFPLTRHICPLCWIVLGTGPDLFSILQILKNSAWFTILEVKTFPTWLMQFQWVLVLPYSSCLITLLESGKYEHHHC